MRVFGALSHCIALEVAPRKRVSGPFGDFPQACTGTADASVQRHGIRPLYTRGRSVARVAALLPRSVKRLRRSRRGRWASTASNTRSERFWCTRSGCPPINWPASAMASGFTGNGAEPCTPRRPARGSRRDRPTCWSSPKRAASCLTSNRSAARRRCSTRRTWTRIRNMSPRCSYTWSGCRCCARCRRRSPTTSATGSSAMRPAGRRLQPQPAAPGVRMRRLSLRLPRPLPGSTNCCTTRCGCHNRN